MTALATLLGLAIAFGVRESDRQPRARRRSPPRRAPRWTAAFSARRSRYLRWQRSASACSRCCSGTGGRAVGDCAGSGARPQGRPEAPAAGCSSSASSRWRCSAGLWGRAADQEPVESPAGRSWLRVCAGTEGRVSASGVALCLQLPPVAELPRAARVHAHAPRARGAAARRRGRGDRRQSSARSRLHELVHHHRPRGRGAHLAGDLDAPRLAVVLPDRGPAARPRAAAARLRHDDVRAGRGDQPGGGDRVLSAGREPVGARMQLLGHRAHDRRRGRERALPRGDRGGADRGLHTARTGALGHRRAAAQDARCSRRRCRRRPSE